MSGPSAPTASPARDWSSGRGAPAYSYVGFGLRIGSDVALPELRAGAGGNADVAIRRGPVSRPAHAAGRDEWFDVRGADVTLGWDGVGAFGVRQGSEIVVDAMPSVPPSLLRTFVLGPALAVLLHQRGRHALHASAVAVDGEAVAFVGPSGAGKSTLAAALHARGHALVADDLVALAHVGGTVHAVPGFPAVKLASGRAGAKQLRRADAFATEPVPLARIFVLADALGSKPDVEPLRPHEAAVEVVRNSWCARLRAASGDAAHVATCARLAGEVPVHRLSYPRVLDCLDGTVARVEAEVRA